MNASCFDDQFLYLQVILPSDVIMTPITEVITFRVSVLELSSKQTKYDQVADMWDHVMH